MGKPGWDQTRRGEGLSHVYPEGDLRDHCTESVLCPCMPLIDRGVVVHNAYDGREVGAVLLGSLDALALGLTDHDHQWTDDQRFAYERAVHLLRMHYPEEIPNVEEPRLWDQRRD